MLKASGRSKETRRDRLFMASAAYATRGVVLGAVKEATNSRLMVLPKTCLMFGLFFIMFLSFYSLFVNKRLFNTYHDFTTF